MKRLLIIVLCSVYSLAFAQQTIKSKALKLKYALPPAWNAEEFGGKTSWEEPGNALCKCSGILFSKSHKEGKMNVLVYPSTQAGLDSAKRNFAGPLRFEDVQKYDKTKNKNFSFEKKRSAFTDTRANKKSYEVIKYFAKVEDHFYIIYAWQENMNALSPNAEKELYEMVNALEPM
jgi:hypothetical protein